MKSFHESPVTVRWLNPVGLADWDAGFGEVFAAVKAPGTTIEVVSFKMQATPTHLEYRAYESLMVQGIVECAHDAGKNGVDAMVIGCFYDPALEDAREMSGDTIIVAPCDASLGIASQLGRRFSILVGRDKWVVQMKERVLHYGQGERLASFRSLGMGVNDFQRDHAFTRARIIEEARRAVAEDKAEVIILGCTLEMGFFEEVQREIGVPVIDSGIAAFKQAEHLARLKKQFDWRPSRVWSSEPPPAEELQRFGLYQTPPALSRQIY